VENVQPGDQSLPVASNVAPDDPLVSAAYPVVPVPAQQEVAPGLRDGARTRGGNQPPDPLLVRDVKDDDLSSFESRTIKYAKGGMLIAALSLAAAMAAAIIFYFQFQEMSKQTAILAESLRKQKEDYEAAAITTGQQLNILQDQLTQQRSALEMDQRPWLKFELGGERPKDADPNNGKSRLLTAATGQPIKIEVRVTSEKRRLIKFLAHYLCSMSPKEGSLFSPRDHTELFLLKGASLKRGLFPGQRGERLRSTRMKCPKTTFPVLDGGKMGSWKMILLHKPKKLHLIMEMPMYCSWERLVLRCIRRSPLDYVL
jgi:hypothetical protein